MIKLTPEFLAMLAKKLNACRTTDFDFEVESQYYAAIGMLSGALHLEACTIPQYNALSALAISAADVRRTELTHALPLHSREALRIITERAA